MVPGKILVTEITGGKNEITAAFAKLKTYMEDNRLVAPAIPFEMFVTNRVEQTDSTKWITKIYYPIF